MSAGDRVICPHCRHPGWTGTCGGCGAIADVKSPRGFSAAVVRRLPFKDGTEDAEEAINEGVVLLYELHGRWDPERCESFYAFCSTYLPLRLISWWRRDARQANLAHRPPGDKGPMIYHSRISLDEVLTTEDDGERPDRQLVSHDSHRIGD